MESDLSVGCLETILSGSDYDKPILQILGTRRIIGSEGSERYRLLVSDGKYLNSFAMLATQLNNLSSSGQLSDNTIIQVVKYISSVVSKDNGEKRVLIILDLSIIKSGEEVGKRIGNPQAFNPSANNNSVNQVKDNVTSKPINNVGSYNPESRMELINANNTLNQSLELRLTNPITSLSPYKSKWVIKARIVSKSPIRTWSNAKGEGKLFSMDLMDESGEIRATAFKNECEKFFDIIEMDKVYYISKCQLKLANKQYSTLNNDYEMTFTPETVVQPCAEAETGIPQVQYNWVPINQISNVEPKSVVDVIGICRDVSALQTIHARSNNREFKKRELTLVDNSNAAIQLTLWGDEATKFDDQIQPVIAVKSAVVTEFGGGKSLTVGGGSVLKINPDFREGHKLRGWFDNGGGSNISSNVSRTLGGGTGFNSDYITFHETKMKNFGNTEKPEYCQVKAVVHLTKSSNAIYKACPQTDCNKKVIDEGNGHFRCEKCNAQTPNFKYRILLNMSIEDWTSSCWVSCFNETAETIIGRTAEDIGEEVEINPENLENIFSTLHFKSFSFKLRSKLDTFGDTQRSKITVVSAAPISYKEYNKCLTKNLHTLLGVGKN